MTKAITNVAVMILFEEGHFKLDDPVSMFIPEFAEMQVMVTDSSKNNKLEKAKRPITIRHLLNHISGLTYDLFAPPQLSRLYVENNIYNGVGATQGTVEDMVKRLAKLPLVHHPGEKWSYGVNKHYTERMQPGSLKK